ncbi:MAG: endonuclease III [Oscillospiraceae bacterium]|nr:endonuclease III [Oscillospiraceae bacterium]
MKNSKMIIKTLASEYPEANCSLVYSNEFELLVAARLSAQCRDENVNRVTNELFKKFRTPEDFCLARPEEIENIIRPCGIFRVKARNIIEMCKKIVKDHNSKVPKSLEELICLPGIGRKTSNLIMGQAFGSPGIIVDTHVLRVTMRLGFHKCSNPFAAEMALKQIIPERAQIKFCHQIVFHGRKVCVAIKPNCKFCILKNYCKYNLVNTK